MIILIHKQQKKNRICLDRNQSTNVESLINILSLLMTEKRFLAAYEDYFDLNQIIDNVYQTTKLL